MSNSRQRPIDKPESLEVALLEDPSGFRVKVMRFSAGEWSKEIHIKHFRKSTRYRSSWSGARKLMSPAETDNWLNSLDQIIQAREWEAYEGHLTFHESRPSVSESYNRESNDLDDPDAFLQELYHVVLELRDEMTR